jgi:hypothetical protein
VFELLLFLFMQFASDCSYVLNLLHVDFFIVSLNWFDVISCVFMFLSGLFFHADVVICSSVSFVYNSLHRFMHMHSISMTLVQ